MKKYGEINNWDTSRVTNMARMFQGAESFNQPLNNWNVSNVKNMAWMFDIAKYFHHHISSYLALTRARSGPNARDEGLNSNGSVAASENARLAANRKATQNEAFPTRNSTRVDP